MPRGIVPGTAELGFPIALILMVALIFMPSALAETEVDILKRALVIQNQRLRAAETQKPHDFVSIRVNTGGSQKDAEAYYDAIAPLINFKDLRKSDLTGLLAYLGFTGLHAADLELLDSALLMPQSNAAFEQLASEVKDKAGFTANLALGDFAKGRVLISRFFAPKIVNFDAPANTDPKQNPYKAG